jgi:adenosylmethionine-8-amino-7-oxononanoate aminotransferase
MTALELTSDRTTKAAPKKDKVNAIYKAIYQNGVMVRISGPNVILSPPLVISEKETAMIIDAIDVAMAANPL